MRARVLVLAALVGRGAAGAASAPPPAPDSRETLAAAVARVVNVERARRGVGALLPDPILEGLAQARAEEAAGADDLDSLEVKEPIGPRAVEAGYEVREVSEIVLLGGEDFEARFRRFAQSDPDPFADAMRADYRSLGVGIAWSDDRLVRALVFGRSAKDEFDERTAALHDLENVRARMLESVNAERRTRRLPPLLENARLDLAAQRHAEDMIRRSYYSHESPEGSSAMERSRGAGYESTAIAENIAEGQGTVAEVMQGWMESPGHREHILGLALKEIGMGVAFGRNARGWEIVWVQVFGVPRAGESVKPRRVPR